MFELRVEDDFSSAHQLREYEGKCENVHGHNWHVELHVRGSELNKIGLLIDFKVMRNILHEIMQ